VGQGIGMNLGVSYRKLWGHRPSRAAMLVALAMWGAVARSQETAPANPPKGSDTPATQDSKTNTEPKTDGKTELSSRDTGTTFKLRVNLVQVRVVVRDKQGNFVDGLKKEDFLLYDNGKLQAVATFGMDTTKTRQERARQAAGTQQSADAGESPPLVVMPQRFVALVFDDIHLNVEDATTVRASAKKLIETMTPTDRIAIYGTSEQISTDFTNNKEALEKGLLQVIPRPKMGKTRAVSNCPDVNHYMADQYVNKGNENVLAVVTQEVLACQFNNDQRMVKAATQEAQSALQEELTAGDTDNDFTYRALEDVMRRMGGLPGEKVMVLAGPGFLLTTSHLEESEVIDRANRANITINTLDARGLYTPDFGDISQKNTDTVVTAGYKNMYRTAQQTEDSYVMMDFAVGTGGTYFHNSNDLEGGLVKIAAAPDICYVLGFSPQGQKMDGRYHSIKVAMAGKVKYEIQARHGYFAPKKVEDPQEQAKQEIAEAVFSSEELNDLAVDIQTQYFKLQADEAKLSVVSRIELKGMHFRKENGRNWDNLTVATVIFDENGNYVAGGEKLLEMRLLDTTYDRLSRTGLTMKSSFDLKPGKYVVRQVVRDSEGAQMAARNGAVVIPY